MTPQNVVAVVQARVGSTRLPAKVLADVGGESMLARVVRRIRSARTVTAVVVATSTLPSDDAIQKLAHQLGAPCVRGSELDVLDRYVLAARTSSADVIVRVTADCPLIDPGIIDDVVRALGTGDGSADYASNVVSRTFPRGLDVEAFTRSALERAAAEAQAPREREHVTVYMLEHPDRFTLRSIGAPVDASRYRWTVDETADLELVRQIYRRVPADAPWSEILHAIESEPALASINADVQQKSTHK
jgi:spore coat polysaccharide biosynthesis protein SpsF